jgi:ribosome-interacting GTPase 1
MVLDSTRHPNQRKYLEYELNAMGIRLNKKKPDVSFKVKTTGMKKSIKF